MSNKTIKIVNPFIKLVLMYFLIFSFWLINSVSPSSPTKTSSYILLLGFIPLLAIFIVTITGILKMIRNIPDKSLINTEPEPNGLTSVGIVVVSFFFALMTIIRLNFSLFSILVFGSLFLVISFIVIPTSNQGKNTPSVKGTKG